MKQKSASTSERLVYNGNEGSAIKTHFTVENTMLQMYILLFQKLPWYEIKVSKAISTITTKLDMI